MTLNFKDPVDMVFQYLGISLSGRSLHLMSQIYNTGKTDSLVDVLSRVIKHFNRIHPGSVLFAHHAINCRHLILEIRSKYIYEWTATC
jgi:hypothetical protein